MLYKVLDKQSEWQRHLVYVLIMQRNLLAKIFLFYLLIMFVKAESFDKINAQES